MSPRILFSLIDEYLDMVEYKASIYALAARGEPFPRHAEQEETSTFEVHPDAF